MNTRERFLAVMKFQKPDAVPLLDMGFWDETMERWQQEGLPASVLRVPEGDYVPGVDLRSYWGADYAYDMRAFQTEDYLGVEHFVNAGRLPIHETIFPFFTPEVLEDRGSTVVVRDGMGVILEKPKHATAFPRFLEFPLKTRADYEKLRPRLDPTTPGRYTRGWEKWAQYLSERGKPIFIWFRGFFGFPRDLMGLENLCTAYYDQPELVQMMMEDRCEFVKKVFTPLLSQVRVDCLRIWEDMAYNHGAMISPRTFRRFMLPYYQEINDFFHQHGVPCTAVDCDGNIVELAGLFAEGRTDAVYPCEIAAGSDPLVLRERYPDLAMIGGVDKRPLAAGPAAIDAELQRLVPVVEQGGFIPCTDHYVPPDVSLANYRYYLKRRRELFG